MNKKCSTCKFHDVEGCYDFYGKNADGMGDIGFCRRLPPMPDLSRLSILKDNKEITRDEVFVFAVFPETLEDEWCGEWDVKTTLEQAEKGDNVIPS